MNITVEEVAQHRNGIGGEPFHVVKFVGEDGPMIGIVFPLKCDDEGIPLETRNGRVAVLQRDLLAEDCISFGENSWRGDRYESELRKAISESEGA